MATVRAGGKPVLLVVDVQVGVMEAAYEAPRVIANVALAVQRARERLVPVVWVQHASHELPAGSPQWQWVPELVPAAGETLIAKRYNSAFEDTPLEATLEQLGATHVVLAGAATNWCIRATAYGALDRGYDLTLVSDAHSTASITLEDGPTIDAATVIADLNVTMKWLQYPGRRTGTTQAAELHFEALATG